MRAVLSKEQWIKMEEISRLYIPSVSTCTYLVKFKIKK